MSDPPSSPSDALDLAALVERARGDATAARELVERCHPLVARLARAHRPRDTPEEDLVQEVFLTLFARLDRYQPRAGVPFEHWLARLAVNVCRDALRAESRRPAARRAVGDEAQRWIDSLALDAAPAVDDALAAREAVDALLAHLEPRDRLLLTLLDIEERPVAEVAALTGVNRALVKVRAFRARRRLRAVAERLGRSGA
jgi:RNA polymerase sigma-70 factor (ECF subfamily)